MSIDYDAIRTDQEGRLEEIIEHAIEKITNLYSKESHFILELLQNAEDALNRHASQGRNRILTFTLEAESLKVSHFGKPFDTADVRSICSIGESAKDDSSIGRFGIGFKSVYQITSQPEIYSGNEGFFIESYIYPKKTKNGIQKKSRETVIVLPFKTDGSIEREKISEGLRNLDPRVLLFLNNIESIRCLDFDNVLGKYYKRNSEQEDKNVRRVTIGAEVKNKDPLEEDWLIFNKNISFESGRSGQIEIAFLLQKEADNKRNNRWRIKPLSESNLVVFFPTSVSTNFKFLIQGPYRTVPARNDILHDDPWNRFLIKSTADLLIEAMRWLRNKSRLDVDTIRCLPLEQEKFPEESIFAPFFTAVQRSFREENLLPKFKGGYMPARQAKIARTSDVRNLFSRQQIANIYSEDGLAWLSNEITVDREPEIRKYIINNLDVEEVTPSSIVSLLDQDFLESQSDAWMIKLYRFLSKQEAIVRNQVDRVPLIRLSDGSHVVIEQNGRPQAYLPGTAKTNFPTIRKSICKVHEVREFFEALGIQKANIVDEVIKYVLPKYNSTIVKVGSSEYKKDLIRIQAAFNANQKHRLLPELKKSKFVKVIDAKSKKKYWSEPETAYFPTKSLNLLFDGVSEIFFVDQKHFKESGALEMLTECGVVNQLRLRKIISTTFNNYLEFRNNAGLKKLRASAGHEETSLHSDHIVDWTIDGIRELIDGVMPKLKTEKRSERARLLWESLSHLGEEARSCFSGLYTWSHYGRHQASFPSKFIEYLNDAAWVPDSNGNFTIPSLVLFESLKEQNWKEDLFLSGKIIFQSPAVEKLAEELNISKEMLSYIKTHNITLSDLESLYTNKESTNNNENIPVSETALESSAQQEFKQTNEKHVSSSDPSGVSLSRTSRPENSQHSSITHEHSANKQSQPIRSGEARKNVMDNHKVQFVSYVGVISDHVEIDPDNLNHAQRMWIESQAIDKILQAESYLIRMPKNNPGFDLCENDNDGTTTRWIEVKAMTSSLQSRPVSLSHTQFHFALSKRDKYWLYIVEYAEDEKRAKILKIQNPAGQAMYFTFDRGWQAVAHIEPQKQR